MILITAFEIFGNFNRNPTIDIAKAIKDRGITYVVPVTFKAAREFPAKVLKEDTVDGVLCMGLAPNRSKISVEAVALNIMHSINPDNDGYAPRFEKVFEDGPPAYINLKNAEKLVEALQNKNLPVRISYSAGGYVCNALYYVFMYYIDKMKLGIPVIFIHFPPDEKMVQKLKNSELVTLDKMISAANYALEMFDTLES